MCSRNNWPLNLLQRKRDSGTDIHALGKEIWKVVGEGQVEAKAEGGEAGGGNHWVHVPPDVFEKFCPR